MHDDITDFGIFAGVAIQFSSNVSQTVHRIRRHIASDDGGLADASAMKASFTPTFAMIGVAGAVLAQIAVQTLSMPSLQEVTWLAEAFFVLCLVSGSFAVIFSCVLQSTLGNLHTPAEFQAWITHGLSSETVETLDLFEQLEQDPRSDLTSHFGKKSISTLKRALKLRRPRPSLIAVFTLTAPMQLLELSVAMLLMGYSVYFVSIPLTLPNGDRSGAIFILYMIGISFGTVPGYFPFLRKVFALFESQKVQRMRPMLQEIQTVLHRTDPEANKGQPDNLPGAGRPYSEHENQDDVLKTMNELIRLQSEQLVQQQHLLQIMSQRLISTPMSYPIRKASYDHTPTSSRASVDSFCNSPKHI
jgi:hypothetical protein